MLEIENLRINYTGPIFIDTKKTDLVRFEGCYVKINQKEFDAAKTFPSDLIVTKGNKGATFKGELIPATPAPIITIFFISINLSFYFDISKCKVAHLLGAPQLH